MRYFEVTDDCGWKHYLAVDDGTSAEHMALMAHTRKVREIDVDTYNSGVRKIEERRERLNEDR